MTTKYIREPQVARLWSIEKKEFQVVDLVKWNGNDENGDKSIDLLLV